jgi:hypothetical protein
MTSVSYDDLVTVATVGVSRRPLPITGLTGVAAAHAGVLDRDDAAATVLDAAALLAAARRAGALPVSGIARPAPAPVDQAPELSPRAAKVLDRARGGDPALLADLLAAASEHGYRAPAPLLPSLLDAAVRDACLRPPVAAVLGARGRWLAAHRPDWRQVAGVAVLTVPDDPAVWETGSRAERRTYLAMLRDRDPAAARDLLAAGWSREAGEERADLLAVVAHGLSPADEEFLEQALDDRKASVRAGAGRLLARLPDSAFIHRAAARAASLLRIEHRGPHRCLAATLPGGVDRAVLRDGIGVTPPSAAVGARAWLLIQLIAAAPLTGWVTRFGLDPGQIVALPVAGNLALEVQAGWRLAAIAQASQEWAEGLLEADRPAGAGRLPPAAWPPDGQLAGVLPPALRAARATALLTGQTVTAAALTEATGCAGPWPEALADAVMAVLARAVTATAWSGSARGLLLAVARNLPVTGGRDYAAALMQLAEGGACPPPWSVALRQAARTVTLRRAFFEEIR